MAELVLVTGGSGYIAGWCVAELLHRGYEVRTTVRDPGREKAVVEAVSAVADPAGRLMFSVACAWLAGPAHLARRGRTSRRRAFSRAAISWRAGLP
jgi:nucleoside-diphosphate-sugar epimerase